MAINSSLGDSAVVAQQTVLSRAFVNGLCFFLVDHATLDSNLAIPQEAEAMGAGAEGIKLVGLFSSETELGVILWMGTVQYSST